MTAQDSGSYTVVLETSRGHRSVTEQIHVKKPIMQPTEAEPMEPDPTLSLSGGSAIGLLAAGILGAGALIAGMCFIIIQSLRYLYPSPPSTGQHPLSPHGAQSWLNKETEMKPTPPSGRVIATPEEPI
eukprot:XP_016881815.1 immunoglobulin superfamily member 23 isoform X8 [Homo sapiens]